RRGVAEVGQLLQPWVMHEEIWKAAAIGTETRLARGHRDDEIRRDHLEALIADQTPALRENCPPGAGPASAGDDCGRSRRGARPRVWSGARRARPPNSASRERKRRNVA